MSIELSNWPIHQQMTNGLGVRFQNKCSIIAISSTAPLHPVACHRGDGSEPIVGSERQAGDR
jgi:hypothetical protein